MRGTVTLHPQVETECARDTSLAYLTHDALFLCCLVLVLVLPLRYAIKGPGFQGSGTLGDVMPELPTVDFCRGGSDVVTWGRENR